MSKKYKHLFFDLDRTLWDFEKSAHEAFAELFLKYQLNDFGIPSNEEFHTKFSKHNLVLWDLYREGKMEKSLLMWKRFYDTLKEYGIDDEVLSKELGHEYLYISPRKVNLFPNTMEILAYLYPKYALHLITNGFQEVQEIKLSASKMDQFFQTLITSEKAGVKKPHPEIFLYALRKTGATAENSLMIGDDYEVDILGAREVGIDQVFFNPEGTPTNHESTFTIRNLIEMNTFL